MISNWYEKVMGNLNFYRGISEAELRFVKENGGILPDGNANELLVFDPEVLSLYFEEEESNENIEMELSEIFPWYDGSITSVKDGINLVTDEDLAEDYAGEDGFVVKLEVSGDFGVLDEYAMAQNKNECKAIAYRKVLSEKWEDLQKNP